MIKVFVVVVNFNGWKDTIGCVESVKKSQMINAKCQIVVVDNGSSDGSWEKIKRIKGIKSIKGLGNLGFAGGNNLGIKYSLDQEADYVMLLNNDTTVKEDLIQHFLVVAKNHPNAGIFTPKIYFAPGFEFHKERYSKKEKGRVIWSVGGVIDWDNVYGLNYGVDDTDIGQYEEIRKTDFATGAAMFVKREVFEKIGLINEDYFLYLEDLEFSQRAKEAGFDILYVPKAVVWHKVSQSSAVGSELNDYFITRNRLKFGLKYALLKAKVALFRESVRLLNKGRKWQRRGVLDFYLGRFGKGSWVG